MNQVFLLGKVKETIQDKMKFTFEVTRTYRNYEGEYEVDLFLCKSWKGINDHVIAYLKNEDILLIKGRMENNDNEMCVMCESIEVLQRRKEK